MMLHYGGGFVSFFLSVHPRASRLSLKGSIRVQAYIEVTFLFREPIFPVFLAHLCFV